MARVGWARCHICLCAAVIDAVYKLLGAFWNFSWLQNGFTRFMQIKLSWILASYGIYRWQYCRYNLSAGQPAALSAKQLLPWASRTCSTRASHGETYRFSPLVVVLGAFHEEILPKWTLKVWEVVFNHHWAEGKSTSVESWGFCLLKMCTARSSPCRSAQIPVQLSFRSWKQLETKYVVSLCSWASGQTQFIFRSSLSRTSKSGGDQGGRAVLNQFQPLCLNGLMKSWREIGIPRRLRTLE